MSSKNFCLSAVALLGVTSAFAHVRQRVYYEPNQTESILHWDTANTPQIKISMHDFSGNLGLANTASIFTNTAVKTLIGTALAQWTGPLSGFSSMKIPLILDLNAGKPYPEPTSCESKDSTGAPDGVNNLLFTTKITDTSCADPLSADGVIGLTKAKYSLTTGEIVEADIQFNDRDFLFDTTNNLNANPKQINLNDVVVHELGHFFGLDHSSMRESTMLFAIAENLNTTKDDDKLGVLSIYAPTGLSSTLGSLTGSLKDENGNPVFGGVVFLVHARTLASVAAEITDLNGAFKFCALPPGPYIVYANSYRPFGPNIHEYYSGYYPGFKTRDPATGNCLNPGCVVMNQDITYSWFTKAPTGTHPVGGLAMKVFNVAAGENQYLNLNASSTPTALSDVPATISGGSSLTVEEPRLTRLTQSDLPYPTAETDLGVTDYDRYTFVAPSTSVAIRLTSLRLYTRLVGKLRLFDSTGITEYTNNTPAPGTPGCSGGNPAVGVSSQPTDPKLICTDLVVGTTYVIDVGGRTAPCKNIPGNDSSCNSSASESASTSVPYYIVTVYDLTKESDATISSAISLDSSSLAATTYANLPTCGTNYSTTVSGGVTGDAPKSSGCCGMIKDGPGGPKGPGSLLFTLLLSPLTWFLLAWVIRESRKGIRL